MLYGLGSTAAEPDLRDYWVEFEITIGLKYGPLIGGIALAGCPFLPYLSTPAGDNVTNFGLPREIRVAWSADGSAGFLDAEQEYTLQMPNWHSGFHFLPFGPVRSTKLRVRLSTFPKVLLPKQTDAPDHAHAVPGFLIPFVYVFGHQETVVYEPHVPAGLLAAWQSPAAHDHTYATQFPGGSRPALVAADPADEVEISVPATDASRKPRYVVYSAASAIGAKRTYQIDNTDSEEFFRSNPFSKDGSVTLILAQARQNEACIAGIRLFTPKLRGALKKEEFELRVFELDLPSGTECLVRSPIQESQDYRVCLVSTRFQLGLAAKGLDVKFVRPSNARVFQLIFSGSGWEAQVLALRSIELIQSAQITLAPKSARRTQVRYVNFRLIGANLAYEYDKLGDGAALEVERLSGAGRKETVFRADSLLDLIERTGAKLYRNGRGWEVVEETAHSESHNNGWQRRENGSKVKWAHADYDPVRVSSTPPKPHWSPTNTEFTFRNFGNQEIRTHTEQLGYQNMPNVRSVVRSVNDLVETITNSSGEVFITPTSATADALVTGFRIPWHDVSQDSRTKLRTLRGLYNLNIPPYALATKYLITLKDLVTGHGNPQAIEGNMSEMVGALALSGLSISAGFSASAIVAGGDVSFSLGQQVPSASRIVQMGDTGSIQLQASDATYQYSQTLNQGFDAATQVRQVLDRKRNVLNSPDIVWQAAYVDILTGRIPLPMTLDAIGSRVYQNTDVAIVVRCLGLNSPNVQADVWFDLEEEEVRDDF
jgi:hypothetical protein